MHLLEDRICGNYHRFFADDCYGAHLLEGVPDRQGVPRLDRIKTAMRSRGYKIYESGRWRLNIVGLRSRNRKAGQFDDWITLFWKRHGEWQFRAYPATTDPSAKYLLKPLSSAWRKGGTAILKPGQYRGAYAIGKHGRYDALVQIHKVTVYRDKNKDTILDASGKEHRGYYGINIHRAHWKDVLQEVGAYSAGCQVIQDPRDFVKFMRIVKGFRSRHGNRFTYTLLDLEQDCGG